MVSFPWGVDMTEKQPDGKRKENLNSLVAWGFGVVVLFFILKGCLHEPPPMTPAQKERYDERQLEYDEIESRQPWNR